MKFEDYPVHISPIPADEGGGYMISFPDLPGCIADGNTIDEAIIEARDAFDAPGSWRSGKTKVKCPRPKLTVDSLFSVCQKACIGNWLNAPKARASA